MLGSKPGFNAVIILICLALCFYGCAAAPTTQRLVVTEYLLTDAGFQKWDVNDTTPKRQALLNNIPKGKVATYKMDGTTYHVYGDEAGQALYVGDEAAYQKYLSLAQGRRVCERVDATNSEPFWSCFDEFQKKR